MLARGPSKQAISLHGSARCVALVVWSSRNQMKDKRWAIVAAIFLLAVLGLFALRHLYWLNQSGLPVYP